MTPELEKYFDDLNELFNHHGYARLKEEISNTISNLSTVENLSSSDELFFRKGQIAALRSILGLEDAVSLAREQAEEDVQDI